jgi:hypothetical protein
VYKNYNSTSATNDSGSLNPYGIRGFALDLDGGSIKYYQDNVLLHTDSTLPTDGTLIFPYMGNTYSGGSGYNSAVANFGQDSSFAGNKTAQGNQDGNGIGDFYYTPPTGFLALCTKNLPDPTVIPSEHFNTVLYAGDNTDRGITGVGFQPDFTWIKLRSTSGGHGLFDAVRGSGKRLTSGATAAETTNYSLGYLNSFDSDGFTVVDGTDADGYFTSNKSGETYVAWNWKGGGAAVSNTSGSITSSVSANVDAGFSIVSYTGNGTTGATVGHGLSSAPEMILHKNRDQAWEWRVYHKALASSGDVDYLVLNNTTSAGNDPTGQTWYNTETTPSVFYIGGNGQNTNNSGDAMLTYCFHSVDGYSKVGSYIGNGSADGTFVHLGFRPAYVMVKSTSGANNWVVHDNQRDPDNATVEDLYPDLSAVEQNSNGNQFDFLSNGFKLVATGGTTNGSGVTFIFLAFAEMPSKWTNAR